MHLPSSSISRITLLLFLVLVLSSCARHSIPMDYYVYAGAKPGVKSILHPTVLKGHPKTVTIKSYYAPSKDQYEDQPSDIYHMEFDKVGNLLLEVTTYSDDDRLILKQTFDKDGFHSHWEFMESNPDNPKMLDTLEVGDKYYLLMNKDTIITRIATTWLDYPVEIYVDTTRFDYKAKTVNSGGSDIFRVDRYDRKGQLVESFYNDETVHTYYSYDKCGNLTEVRDSLFKTYSYISFDRKKNWTKRICEKKYSMLLPYLEVAEYTYW